jgi:DNA-binding NarL/FixJ family response regulator
VLRALIVDSDARSAAHFGETLDRMGVSVFTARSIADAAAAEPPQLLVLTLPVGDPTPAFELAAASRSEAGTAAIFVLDRIDHPTLQQVAALGAGVLCKPVHREQLEAAFRLALEQRHLDRRSASDDIRARTRLLDLERALQRIVQVVAQVDPARVKRTADFARLPEMRPREQEIVRLLFQHLRVPAIARRLGISPHAVRNHLKMVFKRVGVASQQELLDRLSNTDPPAAADPEFSSTSP